MTTYGTTPRQVKVWAIAADEEVLEKVVDALDPADWMEVELFADARRAIIEAGRRLPHAFVLSLGENSVEPDDLLAIREEFTQINQVPTIVIYGDADRLDVDVAMARGVTDAVSTGAIGNELESRIRWALKRPPQVAAMPPSGDWTLEGLSSLRTVEFLTGVISASPNAIVAARRSGEIVLFNPAAEEILGWKTSEALGMDVRKLYPPGGAERIMERIRGEDDCGVGLMESSREVVVSADGEWIPVEISAALVYDGDEEIATVGIFIDLRQQMRMEERLREAMEALEKTQRQAVVAEVAGAAAHELNQPLTSLLGYADYLLGQLSESDELHRVVATIHRDADRIAKIVRKIGRVTRYRTREYPGGGQIVDLEEASSVVEAVPATPEVESTTEVARFVDDKHSMGEQDE